MLFFSPWEKGTHYECCQPHSRRIPWAGCLMFVCLLVMSATSKHIIPIPLFYFIFCKLFYTLLYSTCLCLHLSVYLHFILYCTLYLPLAEVYTRFGTPWPAAGSGTTPDWPVGGADPAPFRPTVAGTYYYVQEHTTE